MKIKTIFGSVAKKEMEEIPMSDLVLLAVVVTPRVDTQPASSATPLEELLTAGA